MMKKEDSLIRSEMEFWMKNEGELERAFTYIRV